MKIRLEKEILKIMGRRTDSRYFNSECEIEEDSRFFRFFKARIPRKLKKAAKYGIERRVYQDENEISPITLVLNYKERVKFVVVGKRNKWKLKARLACEKEERQRIARLWYRCNRMIVWSV